MAKLLRARRSWYALVSSVAIVGLITTAIVWPRMVDSPASSFSGGDPGGEVMSQLTPTVAVLPGYTSGVIPWVRAIPKSDEASFVIKVEPFIDSCDGVRSTRGWSQVVTQADFRWRRSETSLVTLLTPRLGRLGWAPDARQEFSPPGQAWHKELTNGTRGSIQLVGASAGTTGPWFFFATAPPVGKAVSGC